MSRRRSANPTKAISITLPQRLLDEIDDKGENDDDKFEGLLAGDDEDGDMNQGNMQLETNAAEKKKQKEQQLKRQLM